MMRNSEGALDGRLGPDDPAVFAAWAASYRDRLLAAAWALCRNRTEAEDLIQETLSEALMAASRFEGRSAPYTWLYGILRRRFLLHCRGRRRFLRWAAAATPPREDRAPAGPSASASYVEENGVDPRVEPIMKALRNLPAKHREVLHLRYVEGRKIGEIAALISASEGTVKSRLHHALRRVKSAIGREAEAPLAAAGEKAHEL